MDLTLSFLLTWIFLIIRGVQNDESISFSNPINKSDVPESSFWYGTIPSTLLSRDLQMKVYINEPQGLLFYAIDNLYQTLWLEINKGKMVFSYYNFNLELFDPFTYDALIICKVRQVRYVYLNLTFSRQGEIVNITCNGHTFRLFYVPNTQSINNVSLTKFLNTMRYPVPVMTGDNNTGQTYIWIGNTPSSITKDYRNRRLEGHFDKFIGCVESSANDNFTLNLATTGYRHGNMIQTYCDPVCTPNHCNHNGKCIELWRKRFSCDCVMSEFTGEFCNESHAVDFNGQRSVYIDIHNKLSKFQIIFSMVRIQNNRLSTKLLSIQFVLNQHLYIYIDPKRFLQIMLITDNSGKIEYAFRTQIEYDKTYIFLIDADVDTLNFKLVNSLSRTIIEQTTKTQSLPNLITMNITVGDFHTENMKWMNRFDGCISNVILISGKRKFVWNSIPDFKKLPSCVKRRSFVYTQELPTKTVDMVRDDNLALSTAINKDVKTGNTAVIIIVIIIILVIIIIGVVLLVKYVPVSKKHTHKTIIKRRYSPDALIVNTMNIEIPIPYKQPHKAVSLSMKPSLINSVHSRENGNQPPNIAEEGVTEMQPIIS